jgi:hypothetical protein
MHPYWCIGVLVYWCIGVLVYWCIGVLVYWCIGVRHHEIPRVHRHISDEFQKIQTDFADMEKISAVWPREFDSQGISVLNVETRLDNMGLGQEVTKATSNRMKRDRSTEILIAFNSSLLASPCPSPVAESKTDFAPLLPL